MKPDEQDLARRAVAGDAEAFSAIVRLHQNPVFRICLRYLPQADAEDAAQETFLRAFVHRERFDTSRPLLPWLLTIARRLCIDRMRKHTPDLDEEIERTPDKGSTPDAEQAAVISEQMTMLQAALADLPEGQREALVLFHLEGVAYRDIAQTLEVPIGTVMTWLHRGRARLKEVIESGAVDMPRARTGVTP